MYYMERIFFINHRLDDEHGFALLTFYLPTFDFIKIVQVKLKCNHFLSSSCVKLSFTISEKNAKDLTNRGQNDLVARSNTKWLSFQHRRGPLEWLADVGGSLGLYLGASVFTIVEILWVKYLLVTKCLCRQVIRKVDGIRWERYGALFGTLFF